MTLNQHEIIADGLHELGLEPFPGLIGQLGCFVSQLVKWNRTYNLTAIRKADQIITRHLLDSLVIQTYVRGTRVIDVGSGAGFPGIPLALYFPGKHFTLLDSNGKKTRFLQQMKIDLGLDNCEVVNSRVEEFDSKFDQVTCRALASLAEITEKTAHLLESGGEILALKGRVLAEELDECAGSFEITAIHDLNVPGIDAERQLVILRKK